MAKFAVGFKPKMPVHRVGPEEENMRLLFKIKHEFNRYYEVQEAS